MNILIYRFFRLRFVISLTLSGFLSTIPYSSRCAAMRPVGLMPPVISVQDGTIHGRSLSDGKERRQRKMEDDNEPSAARTLAIMGIASVPASFLTFSIASMAVTTGVLILGSLLGAASLIITKRRGSQKTKRSDRSMGWLALIMPMLLALVLKMARKSA